MKKKSLILSYDLAHHLIRILINHTLVNRFGPCGDITFRIHMESYLLWTAMTDKESQNLGMNCITF